MKKEWITPVLYEIHISATSSGGSWGGSEQTTLEEVIGKPMSWYGKKSFEEYFEEQIAPHSGDLTLERASSIYAGS